MQIHVVQPGQSLYGIARAYGVSAQELINTNQIPNPDRLVIGQTIVIPITGRYHWVQRGESVWQIARRYGLTLERLLQVNRVPDPRAVMPGTRLYIPQRQRPQADANAYIEPRGQETERAAVADVAPYLTYATMFDYEVTPEGNVKPLNDEAARAGARTGRAAPIMAITNIRNDKFDRELGEAILRSTQIQQRLLDNVVRIMREKGFRGLGIDFEFLNPEDREEYNAFLQRAADRMKREGFLLSTALAPKVSGEQKGGWYEAHDYAAHGRIADESILMTYEWGWSGGPPRAVAPLDEVEKVIKYAVSVMPPQKILMGIPLYGYDWTLPYVRGGPYAKVVSPQDAIRLAARHGASIQYDRKSQSPSFRYTDQQGKQHEVWFEDARSIQAKFDLVKKYSLRGVSYWKLPITFPQNWLLLGDNFQVRKVGQ